MCGYGQPIKGMFRAFIINYGETDRHYAYHATLSFPFLCRTESTSARTL